jgi:predicted ABC-type transport system involved in lysophospholipase L1 biosynthesis ATPase subunit
VHAGESVSIRGSSGSGKTTLLQLLGGLDVADAGEANFLLAGRGLVPAHMNLGKGVGFVFQNYQLMPELNALENVRLAAQVAGRPATGADAYALLESVGLGGRVRHLPSQLSGGECQRVAIARALINRPSVLLADEPTGNLDEATGAEVMRLLLQVVAESGTALVLVTHSREFAARTDRQWVLSNGLLSPA